MNDKDERNARRLRPRAILVDIVVFVIFLGWLLPGIDWGLDFSARRSQIEPGFQDLAAAHRLMLQSHDDLYRGEKDIFSRWGRQAAGIEERNQRADHYELVRNYPVQSAAADSSLHLFFNMVRTFYLRSYHMDEQTSFMAISNFRPSELKFNPHHFTYGGGFLYPLAASLKIAQLIGYLDFQPSMRALIENSSAARKLYLVGRFFLIFFIALQAWTIYLMVARFTGNRLDGALVALVFVSLPVISVQRAIIKPHLYAPFFGLLGIAVMGTVRDSGERLMRKLALSGALIGVAAGSMILNSLLMLVPLSGLLLLRRPLRRFIPEMIVCGLSFFGAWLAVNPYAILDFQGFYYNYRFLSQFTTSSSAQTHSTIKFFLMHFGPLLLWLIYALFVFLKKSLHGYACLDRRITLPCWIVSISAVGLLVLAGTVDHSIRFIFPVFPALFLAGASASMVGDAKVRKTARLLLVIALFYNLHQSAQIADDLMIDASPSSHRLAAGRWIAHHAPPGSKICILGMESQHVPAFPFARYQIDAYLVSDSAELASFSNYDYIVFHWGSAALMREFYEKPLASGLFHVAQRFETLRPWRIRLDGPINLPIIILERTAPS